MTIPKEDKFVIGGDPYNSADTVVIDLVEFPPMRVEHQGRIIEYNDEYWEKYWGWKADQ